MAGGSIAAFAMTAAFAGIGIGIAVLGYLRIRDSRKPRHDLPYDLPDSDEASWEPRAPIRLVDAARGVCPFHSQEL